MISDAACCSGARSVADERLATLPLFWRGVAFPLHPHHWLEDQPHRVVVIAKPEASSLGHGGPSLPSVPARWSPPGGGAWATPSSRQCVRPEQRVAGMRRIDGQEFVVTAPADLEWALSSDGPG